MFFYKEHLPDINTIVIVKLIKEKENENCFYVNLPEFNNIEGVINKAEFSKKVKKRNKTFTLLRKEKTFPCVVYGHIDNLVELSIHDIDDTEKEMILNRHFNINRILKIYKFISTEYKLDYYDTVKDLYNNKIKQLYKSDMKEGKINDYKDTYYDMLVNTHKIVNTLNVTNKLKQEINSRLMSMIKEGTSTSYLNFDLCVWKADKDAIYVIRDLFTEIKNSYNNVDICYIGAPTYQMIVKSQIKDMDNIYLSIGTMIKTWMGTKNVTGYGLKLDHNNKEVKSGDIVITYPFRL